MTDKYYDVAEDSIQEGYPQELTFAESNASFIGGIDDEGHLKVDDMYGVQTKTFFIRTPPGATLESLQANHKDGYFWNISPQISGYLRHVGKSVGRKDASEKDRHGVLSKALLLAADILHFQSNCPKDLSIDAPGLVPSYISETGRHTFVIPAHSNGVINQNICQPDNLITKDAYEKNEICSVKTLQNAIRFDIDPNKQTAHITTNTFPFQILCNNMNDPNGAYYDIAEAIYAKNKQVFSELSNPGHKMVVVPAEIGKNLYDTLAQPLKDLEKRYVDLGNYKVKISPADGKAWNHVDGLIGESAVFGAESTGFEREQKLNTPISAYAAIQIKYVLAEQ